MTKEIWIVEGICTDPECGIVGYPEWQFSDGPPGERGSSADYRSLEEGLRANPGCTFHFVPQEDSAYEFTVKFQVPYEELLTFWKSEGRVGSLLWTMGQILQRDLYDDAGMLGNFQVIDSELLP